MISSLKIEVKTVNEFFPDLARTIRSRRDREFGDDSMVYADPEWYLLGYVNGELVAQVGILKRGITIDGRPLTIGGGCFLITEPEYRGRGYGTAMMSEAVAFIKDNLGLPYGLLTCKRRLESLYAGMGWKTLDAPNVFDQPSGPRSCGGIIMVNECGGQPWPEGKIDFCGLPW